MSHESTKTEQVGERSARTSKSPERYDAAVKSFESCETIPAEEPKLKQYDPDNTSTAAFSLSIPRLKLPNYYLH